ncbi:hypothetical protein [Streptomyces zaomyceticus]|uniref:hypothetical protein n=1 Tax=Streptomyces zaomyceticus TaxID=68286 RepID=UPI0037B33D64
MEVVQERCGDGHGADDRAESRRGPGLADGDQGAIQASSAERGDERGSTVPGMGTRTRCHEKEGDGRQDEHADDRGLEHPLGLVVLPARTRLQACVPSGRWAEPGDDVDEPIGFQVVARPDVGKPLGRLVQPVLADHARQSAVAVVDVLTCTRLPQGRRQNRLAGSRPAVQSRGKRRVPPAGRYVHDAETAFVFEPVGPHEPHRRIGRVLQSAGRGDGGSGRSTLLLARVHGMDGDEAAETEREEQRGEKKSQEAHASRLGAAACHTADGEEPAREIQDVPGTRHADAPEGTVFRMPASRRSVRPARAAMPGSWVTTSSPHA